jgi:C4-dicarboxylate-specific signal transduction histidine kinase
VTNLINNSIAAFEESKASTREIWVETEVAEENFVMKVSDNGPGITVKRINDIWLPGFSTRPNGTGLGLAIVRDSVMDLGGTVDASANGAHGGAEFVVTLPILGA